MTRVVCVGDLMVDVLAPLPGPLNPGSDTPAPISVQGGGAAANVAAWVATAGGSSTFCGRVGADPFGRRAVLDLQASGVDVRVEVDPQRPTGICIVLVDPSGERTMIPNTGANAGPSAPLPDAADWLYVSGYALLDRGSRPMVTTALDTARERGWAVAVDAASAAMLGRDGPTTFLGQLEAGAVLFANEDEAVLLTGAPEPAAAVQALAQRCGEAVVKRGAGGALWSDGTGVRSVAGPDVIAVDTTGAGDAFAAGFVAAGPAGATGPGPDERLKAATTLAAQSVARLGARPPA